jgi:hypothetical protein
MTTALTTASRRSGLIAWPVSSNGRSESAKTLGRFYGVVRQHLLGSLSLRSAAEQALADLEKVRTETSAAGWDGYGAIAMNEDAYCQARTFIQALPTTVPAPEISLDPDGEVAVDWTFGKSLRFSVSVGKRGRLTFASLLGNRAIDGTEWLDTGIPATILNELTAIATEAKDAGLI